jgi:hypothetical protein
MQKLRNALTFCLLVATTSAFPTFRTIHNLATIKTRPFSSDLGIAYSRGPILNLVSSTHASKVLLRGKQQPEDDEETNRTWLDRFFDPIVNKYAELPESDQSMLASIYQSAYFMLCVYIGIVMVKAYKHSIENSGGIG